MYCRASVEHRWARRKPVAVPVTIYHEGKAVGRGRTRNLGHDGVFVEADAGRFPVYTVLELELPPEVMGRRAKRRIPGLVIHGHGDGVGLMFCGFDRHLFEGIDELSDVLPRRRRAAELVEAD